MRLLKLGVYHPTYLRQFYAARPALATQPYATQLSALLADCYGSSDFWTVALGKLGYEASDIVANAEPLQRRWAQDHGVNASSGNWLFEITAAQVKTFQPDVLCVADYSTFTAPFLHHLRQECSAIRLIVGWCGAPYSDPAVFGAWDVVLSCIPELVAHFRASGHRSHHLDHAFEPRILNKIDSTTAPNTDFAFLGSVLKQDQFHLERERLLLQLIEQTGLQIWSDLKPPARRVRHGMRARGLAYDAVRAARAVGVSESLLTVAPLARKAAGWTTRPALTNDVDRRIARRARAPLFGLAMFQQLHDSRVALNTHIDISPVSASNMRLFEATGVGTCLLTDWKRNLAALFEPDVEVLTYRSAAECIEKVKYILAHEHERRAIAAAGQRRALREHNFDLRAARLDEIIRAALLKPASSCARSGAHDSPMIETTSTVLDIRATQAGGSLHQGAATAYHVPDAPCVVIKPRKSGLRLELKELWSYRELLYFLAWRDIKVRYKQTVLGATWAVLQPLLAMCVFTLLFGRLEGVTVARLPYPLFTYSGLLLWLLFANAVTNSSNSLVASSNLITKVYFPRVLIPAATVVAGTLDFVIASVFLGPLALWYGVGLSATALLAPAFVLLTMLSALGAGLWLSALNVKYRDVRYALPFAVQLWLFVSAVIAPASVVPQKFRWLLWLNPLTGIIENFRAALFGGVINWTSLLTATAISLVVFGSALLYFRRIERSFADVV